MGGNISSIGGVIAGIIAVGQNAVKPSSLITLDIHTAELGQICVIVTYSQLHDVQPVATVLAPYTQVVDHNGERNPQAVATIVDIHISVIIFV